MLNRNARPCCAVGVVASLTVASSMLPAGPTPGRAQQDPCDARIIELAQGTEHPYQRRGDRCEGTFKQQVASGLRLRSIYQSFQEFDLRRTRDPLIVEWSAPATSAVALRAEGRVGEQDYRLDVLQPAGSDSLIWGTRILRALAAGLRESVTREDLAVQGRVDYTGLDGEVFVPLRIWQREKPESCGPVRFVFWATTRPASVSYEVKGVDVANATQTVIARRDLGRILYPLNGPLDFEVPEIQEDGIYSVTVAADLGEPWSRTYLVFVAPGHTASCATTPPDPQGGKPAWLTVGS